MSNFAKVFYQPLKFTIMKRELKMRDFWEYVARIQEEVTNEVLNQVTKKEYCRCKKTVDDYMYNLRNVQFGRIQLYNKGQNKYVPLINEALKKRNIFIYSDFINIAFC